MLNVLQCWWVSTFSHQFYIFIKNKDGSEIGALLQCSIGRRWGHAPLLAGVSSVLLHYCTFASFSYWCRCWLAVHRLSLSLSLSSFSFLIYIFIIFQYTHIDLARPDGLPAIVGAVQPRNLQLRPLTMGVYSIM